MNVEKIKYKCEILNEFYVDERAYNWPQIHDFKWSFLTTQI